MDGEALRHRGRDIRGHPKRDGLSFQNVNLKKKNEISTIDLVFCKRSLAFPHFFSFLKIQ